MREDLADTLKGTFWLIVLGVMAGGWIANVVKLVAMQGGPDGWMVARGVGIVLVPLGAVLGFL